MTDHNTFIHQTVGERIRICRKVRRLTTKDVGAALYHPLSIRQVQRIERGDALLTVGTLFDISRALRVRPEHLLRNIQYQGGV